jgi:hypothetical protein
MLVIQSLARAKSATGACPLRQQAIVRETKGGDKGKDGRKKE